MKSFIFLLENQEIEEITFYMGLVGIIIIDHWVFFSSSSLQSWLDRSIFSKCCIFCKRPFITFSVKMIKPRLLERPFMQSFEITLSPIDNHSLSVPRIGPGDSGKWFDSISSCVGNIVIISSLKIFIVVKKNNLPLVLLVLVGSVA